MFICCEQEIQTYRVFGAYIPLFHEEPSDAGSVAENRPLLFRYGGIFKPQAHLECPKCGRIYLFSLKAPILQDMTRVDNRDLWDEAGKVREELSKKD